MIEGICIGAMILSIWFLTEWRVHFFNSMGWECHSANVSDLLQEKFNFGIRDFTLGAMLSCPFCLGFWLALILSIFFGNIAVIYIGQMVLFGLLKKLNSH